MIKGDQLIQIITDSTCDIPEDLVQRYNIKIIPHTLIWGTEQYLDRIDIQPVEFYERFVRDPVHPTTAQANIPQFQQAYKEAKGSGASEVLVLTVSSAMSGAYQCAVNAAEDAGLPVTVIDSKGPTFSLGFQVLAAARALETGLDVPSVVEKVAQVRQKLIQLVAMNTIEYLNKSGRIGDAIKWVGGILQVKPLVSINHQTGRVEPVTLARTHTALVEAMHDRFIRHLQGGKKLHIAVLHGNVKAEGEALAERLRNELHPDELIFNITGPVLGINTGPGALALCGYAEE